MNWNNILLLRHWSPISEIEDEIQFVSDGLYSIGQDAYVRTQMFNRRLELGDPSAPFITKAFWGSSVDAVKREIFSDPEIGAEPVSAMPPVELSLGTSGQYGQVLKCAREARGNFSERAVYSSSGKFLYKVVTTGRLEFCFLDNEENHAEQTFLIQASLVK